MDTCLCMAESLCCSPGTTTTLLIGYTPIQNVFGVFFLKRYLWLPVVREDQLQKGSRKLCKSAFCVLIVVIIWQPTVTKFQQTAHGKK